ncbi:MAG: sigma-70 family RNA polymerase sigma factor [Myxococcota bacterium]
MGRSLETLYRRHASTLIARLVRAAGGRVDWAESAVQDAFVRATTHFADAVPDNPEAWLYRVARNRLTDLARHEQVHLRAQSELERDPVAVAPAEPALATEWDDELLQMIVATCDPRLTPDEQVALALRILCGLPRSSIALVFRAEDETIKKRLTSAKKKLREAASLDVPQPVAADARVDAAVRVLYLVFTEGHKPRSGAHTLRADLCAEAIRLAEVLLRKLPARTPTLHALLALMKLGAARLPARDKEGEVVLLEHQDRSLWDDGLIDAGLRHLKASAEGDTVTPYHLEATIAACHCLAPDFASTDWGRIVSAYDALLAGHPSTVLAVNRAVAVGFHRGHGEGISALRSLPPEEVLGYLPYHAALGSLSERAGDLESATSSYRVAANLSHNDVDRAFFEGRLDALR